MCSRGRQRRRHSAICQERRGEHTCRGVRLSATMLFDWLFLLLPCSNHTALSIASLSVYSTCGGTNGVGGITESVCRWCCSLGVCADTELMPACNVWWPAATAMTKVEQSRRMQMMQNLRPSHHQKSGQQHSPPCRIIQSSKSAVFVTSPPKVSARNMCVGCLGTVGPCGIGTQTRRWAEPSHTPLQHHTLYHPTLYHHTLYHHTLYHPTLYHHWHKVISFTDTPLAIYIYTYLYIRCPPPPPLLLLQGHVSGQIETCVLVAHEHQLL
jgi:hypothetical protein